MAREIEFSTENGTFSLCFGMAAMVRFERATGRNALVAAQTLTDALEDPDQKPIELLGGIFHASLKPWVEDEAEALEIMDDLGIARAMGLLGEALESAMAGLEEPEKSPPNASRKTRSRRG